MSSKVAIYLDDILDRSTLGRSYNDDTQDDMNKYEIETTEVNYFRPDFST